MKLIFYLFILPFTIFCIYVAIVNRHSKNMTIRQMVLKAVYPGYMWFSKKISKSTALSNKSVSPTVSLYSLTDTLIDDQPFSFEHLRGKKILFVNTASDCVYTEQYADLERLSRRYEGKLIVLGFPTNDFNEQEKGDNSSIASFCKKNFGIEFLLMKKTVVKKSAEQNRVYQWLTQKTQNGWCNKQPDWNFSKFLVNEEGKLVNYFPPSISPLDPVVIRSITDQDQ